MTPDSRIEIDHIYTHTIPAYEPATRQLFDDGARYGSPLNDQGIGVSGYGQDIRFRATLSDYDLGVEGQEHSLFDFRIREPSVSDNDATLGHVRFSLLDGSFSVAA